MTKRTKIIATIGPATNSEDQIKKLIHEGVNIFRFNTKHSDVSWHRESMQLVRKISEELDLNIGILVDLQGPDVRIGELSKQELDLTIDKELFIEDVLTEQESIQLKKSIIEKINVDQEIAIDDGKHRLKVIDKISNEKLKVKVIQGATLTSKKGIFFPDLVLNIPAISDRDYDYIKLAVEMQAEYVALSFVRTKEDINILKQTTKDHGRSIKIVAKIETLSAVKNIEEILDVTDAIMVARGDLGVEIHLEAVPAVQKKLIEKSIRAGKPVIVATQMLKSMIESPLPTRAEISDIANASFDLADAVMLSEESAIGAHPIKAVEFMARTLKYNELMNVTNKYVTLITKSQADAIVLAADSLQNYLIESDKNPVGFVVLTESGKTAQLLSATRPQLPIFAFTQDSLSARELSLCWGVQAFTIEFKTTVDESVREIIEVMKTKKLVKHGECLIFISGQNIGTPGETDSLRVVTV